MHRLILSAVVIAVIFTLGKAQYMVDGEDRSDGNSDGQNSRKATPGMHPLSTHVLDVSIGLPAANVSISVYRIDSSGTTYLNQGKTNSDGRLGDLLTNDEFIPGTYKLKFETGEYFRRCRIETFFPYVEVVFNIQAPVKHHHVPLLLSPYHYSTYRGS